MRKIYILLLGFSIGLFSSNTAAVVEVPPTFPIMTPADARMHGLEDLRTAVKQDGGVPLPNLKKFLKPDRSAQRKLEQLGKILFWDQQVGSKGQACASCHFHAGADNRIRDQVSPGLLRRLNNREGDIRGYHAAAGAPDETFQTKQPVKPLRFADFPLIKNIQDFMENDGVVTPTPPNSNDVISSQGVFREAFIKVRPGNPNDKCEPVDDPVFKTATGNKVRRVEPRHTPSVINAVFNAFNFWDGRANHFFNGQNPFGVQDPNATIFVVNGGNIQERKIALKNSSLASQAVGPPNSDFEMACGVPEKMNARTWPEIGKKLLRKRNGVRLTPLGLQMVDKTDSLIGGLSNAPAKGVSLNYKQLIKRVFREKYWKAPDQRIVFSDGASIVVTQTARPMVTAESPLVVPATTAELAASTAEEEAVIETGTEPALTDTVATGPTGPRFTLMEANMALFFGLAVQAYQAKLVSDNSWFDKWMRTGNFNAGFGEAERKGLNVFVDKGKCINCHGGPEMTNASVRNFQGGNNLIEPMAMGNNEFAIYDNGFYNIAVSLTTNDLGRGGTGPIKLKDGTFAPLSSSRQRLFEEALRIKIPFKIIGRNRVLAITEDEGVPVCNDINGNGFCDANEPLLPAFQRAAVDGAMKTPGLRNQSITGPYFHNGSAATLKQVVEFYDNGGNFCHFNLPDLDPDIQPLDLTEAEKRQLVKFLVSLTDRRVEFKKAPFDHPSLTIPLDGRKNGAMLELPAVGRNGSATPLATFLGLNPQSIGQAPVNARCSKDGRI